MFIFIAMKPFHFTDFMITFFECTFVLFRLFGNFIKLQELRAFAVSFDIEMHGGRNEINRM